MQDWNQVDPFTQIYQAILQGIAADVPLQQLVSGLDGSGAYGVMGQATGNLPDLTDPNFEMPESGVNVGNAPYMTLGSSKFKLLPFGSNSLIAEFDQTYSLVCNAADLKLLPIHKIKTRLLIIFVKLGPILGLEELVRGYELTDGDDTNKKAFGSERIVSTVDITVTGYGDAAYLLTL